MGKIARSQTWFKGKVLQVLNSGTGSFPEFFFHPFLTFRRVKIGAVVRGYNATILCMGTL